MYKTQEELIADRINALESLCESSQALINHCDTTIEEIMTTRRKTEQKMQRWQDEIDQLQQL